ncbi:MAG: TIGR03984 family CRISPR-associated protein [Candidatus Promineofilum sp.]|nr:TIGR03984 family CRISPR-associated protein [Promineifilum sp.]MCW5864672.1 TIGR03984 family CRISPR-associated protein [Anaerolineae bacterium]
MSTQTLDNVAIEDAPGSDAEVPVWLAGKATAERRFLLAFADDGVIWGQWANDQLVTSADAVEGPSADRSRDISPSLRSETLQQASLFGPADEVRLFRDELGRWQARRITDGPDFINESQLLVGDEVVANYGAFTHVRDRIQQGIDHIAPVELSHQDVAAGRGPRLLVRHSIDYEESGEARISVSRLVEVRVGRRAEEEVR